MKKPPKKKVDPDYKAKYDKLKAELEKKAGVPILMILSTTQEDADWLHSMRNIKPKQKAKKRPDGK